MSGKTVPELDAAGPGVGAKVKQMHLGGAACGATREIDTIE